ncbi:MAG: DUF4258 domain-containing protein [bacterium]
MRILFRVHAIQRMFRRGIAVEDVRAVLEAGETIERYPDDTPLPSRLVLGWRGTRALHVVVADNEPEDKLMVITVYEPDIGQWEPGFRRRRP